MGRTRQAGWPEKHTDALKAHQAAGRSSSRIAVLINEEFGTSYTRNAVIGRSARIGLVAINRPGASAPRKTRAPRERKPRVRIIQANGNSNRHRIIESVESEPIALRCAEVIPLNISLDDLNSDVCHYPYGDTPPFSYCGHVTLGGAAYCDLHHELCHKPAHFHLRGRERPDATAIIHRAMLPGVLSLALAGDGDAL